MLRGDICAAPNDSGPGQQFVPGRFFTAGRFQNETITCPKGKCHGRCLICRFDPRGCFSQGVHPDRSIFQGVTVSQGQGGELVADQCPVGTFELIDVDLEVNRKGLLDIRQRPVLERDCGQGRPRQVRLYCSITADFQPDIG